MTVLPTSRLGFLHTVLLTFLSISPVTVLNPCLWAPPAALARNCFLSAFHPACISRSCGGFISRRVSTPCAFHRSFSLRSGLWSIPSTSLTFARAPPFSSLLSWAIRHRMLPVLHPPRSHFGHSLPFPFPVVAPILLPFLSLFHFLLLGFFDDFVVLPSPPFISGPLSPPHSSVYTACL